MNHIDKCRVCDNYLRGVDTCKYCNFEWSEDYPPCVDTPFDIFDLDDDIEWIHLQLLDRLHYKGIECLSADIWFDNNVAFIIGARASPDKVAEALHIHKEVIYDHSDMGLMILNLFQEKYLRGLI